MRTLFQIIQQEFQKEMQEVFAEWIHEAFSNFEEIIPQDQRQEVPVPVCWLEKKAELPEP